jgi:hypothetical protein
MDVASWLRLPEVTAEDLKDLGVSCPPSQRDYRVMIGKGRE